jgi:glyoxylase-like metal-dependent hydrolase (beta-lactamase superfamily II)
MVAGAAAAFAVPAAWGGQEPDYSKVLIKATEVSGSIQASLKSLGITDKPVRFVNNTHYHGDHTGGNTPFSSAGSTVIAQDNVRKRLESGGTAGNGGSIKMEVKPAEKAALPIITFEHDVTVHLNGEDIRALHFPSGHTDGDSIIFSRRTMWCTWATISCATDFRLSMWRAAGACRV